MNGYFAIQLDKQSQNVVSKNATMPVMVSDHITLAYKPVKKVYDKYSKLIGKKVGAFIKGYRSNKNIDALGYEPSSTIANLANKKGVKTFDKFFNTENLDLIKSFHKNVDVISSANVIAHIPDLINVIKKNY